MSSFDKFFEMDKCIKLIQELNFNRGNVSFDFILINNHDIQNLNRSKLVSMTKTHFYANINCQIKLTNCSPKITMDGKGSEMHFIEEKKILYLFYGARKE